jgi:triosephosphate isomerase (TIM)
MIIAANWKMNLRPCEAQNFFKTWSELNPGQSLKNRSAVFFLPPYYWPLAQSLGLKNLAWGTQNMFSEDFGAFTGENSPVVAKEMGAQWALVGHSERRQLFGETGSFINKKVLKALNLGFKVLLCVGETLEQRQSGLVQDVLDQQLQEGLTHVVPNLHTFIAYEPVWAIGTGLTARQEDITKAHRMIRHRLLSLGFSPETPILYGGSVKPENSSEILSLEDVSGLLVGGASLKPDPFFKILNS